VKYPISTKITSAGQLTVCVLYVTNFFKLHKLLCEKKNTPTSIEEKRLHKNIYTVRGFQKRNINIVVFWLITPCTLMRATNISDEENDSLLQVTFKMKALCPPKILVTTYQPMYFHNSLTKYVSKKLGSSLLPHNYSRFTSIHNIILSTSTKLSHHLPGSTRRDDLTVQVRNPMQAWLKDHVHF